jgi:Protein of unknown function with HXXEE motif
MEARTRTAFGLLMAAQAAHSVEEYVFRLYDVFGPARFVAGLFSPDLAVGFAAGNAAIVLFGVWCYLARVRPAHPSARAYAWFWTVLEAANGGGHILMAAARDGYFPGVATAPLLLGLSLYLGARLSAGGDRSATR